MDNNLQIDDIDNNDEESEQIMYLSISEVPNIEDQDTDEDTAILSLRSERARQARHYTEDLRYAKMNEDIYD